MERAFTASTRPVVLISLALFGAVVWRAVCLPLSGTEAAVWEVGVRPRFGELWVSPDAWSGLVYGLLAKRTAGLFRLSEFSLRLPAVLSALLYLWAVHRICRSQFGVGPRFWAVFLGFAIPPVVMDYFIFAGGTGLPLALCALAAARIPNPGLWLGLALSACPVFWVAPVATAGALLILYGWQNGMDLVVVPGVATAFVILIIPLSHGGPPLPLVLRPGAADAAVKSAVMVLRSEAGNRPVRISASPDASALLDFYRARYRERGWTRSAMNPDYFLWSDGKTSPANRAVVVLFRQAGVVLAR